jgi:hypothetical protein
MIQYGQVKSGVFLQGDAGIISIVSHFLGSTKNQFFDQIDSRSIFCSPDPRATLIPAVAEYLDSAGTLEAPKVADVHDQPRTKAKSRR